MDHILSMEYVSLAVNLLSLYCGSLLNSFLCKAEDSPFEALSQELAWDLGLAHPLTPFSCNIFTKEEEGGLLSLPTLPLIMKM